MKGLFDVPKGQFGNGDTNGQFRFNPMTQQQERSWIKYADGVYEPERKDGSLRKKKDDHRQFQWWQVNKPADWKPQDEGADFSWNHTLGATDDFADQKTGKPLSPKAGKQKQQVEPLKLDLPPQDGEPFNGKTLLGMGGAAVDAYGTDEKETAQPSPRNSAQDAADLRKHEQRTVSSNEHARDLNRLEEEQNHSGADAAATAGALGGMVQSKGQSKGGKASGNDPRIRRFVEEYELADSEKRKELKKIFKNEINELRKEGKQKGGKKGKVLAKRASQWAGALKVITDGKVRPSAPIIFNVDIMKKVLQGIPPEELGQPDKI